MYAFFTLFHYNFFVILWRSNFKWPIFDFTEIFFCSIKCAVNALYCIFIHSLNSSAPEFLFDSYSWFVFFISLNCLSLFSYASLSFLTTVILNYLLHKSQISMSLGSVTRRLLWSYGCIFFLIFHVFLEFCISSFAFEVAVTSSNLYWVQGRNVFHNFCYIFWGFLKPCMNTPAVHFLLYLLADLWCLYVFCWCYNILGLLMIASVLFSWRWCY